MMERQNIVGANSGAEVQLGGGCILPLISARPPPKSLLLKRTGSLIFSYSHLLVNKNIFKNFALLASISAKIVPCYKM